MTDMTTSDTPAVRWGLLPESWVERTSFGEFVSYEDYQALERTLTAEREKNAINEEKFAEWFCREIPPGTVIANPKWWVPKILRAMKEKK